MDLKSDLKGLLTLWLVPGLGPRKIGRLLERFVSSEKIFGASSEALTKVAGITPVLAQKILKAPLDPGVEQELLLLEKNQVSLMGISSTSYPERLKQIHTAPPVLYQKGTLDLGQGTPIAFVGSRKASFSGKSFCQRLIRQLADISSDIVIISGLALGIDTVAHQTALDCGLKTVGVLAGGLSSIYPAQNSVLSTEICKNGALITEFPFLSRPTAQNFPLRNRIISGLSRGVVVVEAGEKSGALITARDAIEQNRELFAAPGPADSVYYRGTNRLIQRGHAKLIMDAADIIEEIGLQSGPPALLADAVDHSEENLSIEEMSIIGLIEEGPKTVDEMSTALNIPMSKLKSHLTLMELKGKIVSLSGAQYAKKAP